MDDTTLVSLGRFFIELITAREILVRENQQLKAEIEKLSPKQEDQPKKGPHKL